jgi:L-lactate dehydrogenase complex protein LldF
MGVLGLAGRDKGRFKWLPLSRSWTKHRDFPAPQGETFQSRWARERGRRRAA